MYEANNSFPLSTPIVGGCGFKIGYKAVLQEREGGEKEADNVFDVLEASRKDNVRREKSKKELEAEL